VNLKAPALNCPLCGCTSNKLVGVSELFKGATGHRPTTILGPGKFVATDIDVPLACDGPVAMLRFNCLMGHAWGMTLREDRKRVYCSLHRFQDWEHQPTAEQLQKLVADVEKVDEHTKYAALETELSAELKKLVKSAKKKKPKSS